MSKLGAFALTRGPSDAESTTSSDGDDQGFFLYIKDVASGALWSAGLLPTRTIPSRYAIRRAPQCVEIVREDEGIELHAAIALTSDECAELRRYTFINRGATVRRLELTTYAEVVLNTPAGDAGHPAFSKLFVQTEFDAAHSALFARRRQRSPDDATLWVAHSLVPHSLMPPDALSAEPVMSVETDRMRFIGRGRTLASPRALDGDGVLSGTTGNVLDPIVAIRRSITIEPGTEVTVTAVLGAGEDKAAAARVVARFDNSAAIDVAIAAVASDGAFTDVELPDLPSKGDAYRAARASDAPPAAPEETEGDELLQSWNGYGGFSSDGCEYVIRLPASDRGPVRPPLPWVNVIANENIGFLVSESGAANTWCANSREHRLTPWYNDPVIDPHGEALYLRDEEARVFWSPTAGPAPAPGAYEVRHGFGYSRFTHESFGLQQEVTQFVARTDPVKLTKLRVANRSNGTRSLSAWSCSHLVLGVLPNETATKIVLAPLANARGLLAIHRDNGEFSSRVVFAMAGGSAARIAVSGDGDAFLGTGGSPAAPRALRLLESLDHDVSNNGAPCAALQASFTLAPNESVELYFALGEGDNEAHAASLVQRYSDIAAVDAALRDVQEYWQRLVSAVQVETPSPAIDLMVNGWLTYQNLSCRMMGRTAFYQSGGAFGFRDQLQDAAALIHHDATITRRQILLHAAHQFVEGDVLHWWHPPLGKGIRTRFSDDLLWLPFVTAYYAETTGDWGVLDEVARYVTAPQLEDGEDEVFVVPSDSGVRGDVYDHCCRVIDRSLTRGAHGLPLMGTGDWNDGMNRVGREGRGESVWLGFFLACVLDAFIPIAARRGDDAHAVAWRAYRQSLGSALNNGGWDGAWYRRAYYDDGTPLGSFESDECRIDAIAQAWSVISRVAPNARAEQALDAMERDLVDEEAGIIRLLTPAFDRTPHDPGYIKGYLPGVRENGGQYTHGALWAVRALAEAGRTERAVRLLEMLSPVSHAEAKEHAETYQVEPYVIAADVYGVAPHVGRGGWTWYTGSAGWMSRVAVESVLGVRIIGGDRVHLRPCIPASWPGFTVRLRCPNDTQLEIVVSRSIGATRVTLDGVEVPIAVKDIVVAVPSGSTHRVELRLGDDYVPEYSS